MRTDVIDQTLAIAMLPTCDCKTAILSANTILCLAQSPGTHAYIARKEVVEDLLQMCELKEKIISKQQPSKQGEKEEDPMAVNALKYGNFPSLKHCMLHYNGTNLRRWSSTRFICLLA